MNLPEEWFVRTGGWLGRGAPEDRMVLSSRIRLARNIEGLSFPPSAGDSVLAESFGRVSSLPRALPVLKNVMVLGGAAIDPLEREILIERHLISKDLPAREASGVLVDPEEYLSIMVNEEDHLRIQVLAAGLDLLSAWRIASMVEREMDGALPFAFDAGGDLGYLTSCPTNLGTGMRASVLLHLPALVLTKRIDPLFRSAGELGILIRGFYGEGTKAKGNIYQISNRITLGRSEEEILVDLESWVRGAMREEAEAREELLSGNRTRLEDIVHRGLAVLSFARLLSSDEMMTRLSMVGLGIDTGILEGIGHGALHKARILGQPAHLLAASGKTDAPPRERDRLRADLCRELLGSP